MTRGLLPRIVAATTASLVVAATCVLAQSPAAAAVCSSDAGVSVVVDPGALGGGIGTVCDPGSGEVASTRFEQSGFALTYAQRQPGFVCRVNGAPASDPCVNTSPADAYWGLFWTDGTSGTWTYSSLGATSLDVPDGGAVALAWQQGTRRSPGVAAPVHEAPSPTAQPTATPTRTPSKPPTRAPTATPTATPTSSAPGPASTSAAPPTSATSRPTGGARATPSPSSSPTRTRSPRPTPSPASSQAAEPAPAAAAAPAAPAAPAAQEPEDSGRVPTWLTLTILGLLLFALAVSTAAARRRTRR